MIHYRIDLTSLAEQSSSSDVGSREFLGPVTGSMFCPQSRAWSTRVCSMMNVRYLRSTQALGSEPQSL